MEEERKRIFDLLDRARQRRELTVRDDQFDFSDFLEAAKACRQRGGRFRFVDTGKLSLFELEWLAEAGADIYTSAEIRSKVDEFELLAKACSRSKAVVACFSHGPLWGGQSDKDTLGFLQAIGQRGAYIHHSNRQGRSDLGGLEVVASSCRAGGSWLVYYHHGPWEEELARVAREDAWVHLSDKSLSSQSVVRQLIETMGRRKEKKLRLVIHIEEGLSVEETLDLERAGAFLLFKTPPSDYRSDFWEIEKRASRRRLDFRAYYLYTTFLL